MEDIVPNMAVHAVHPGENVEEHGVAVQKAAPAVIVELLRRHTQQVPQVCNVIIW